MGIGGYDAPHPPRFVNLFDKLQDRESEHCAEVVALAEGIPHVLLARDLLHDLGIIQTQPVRIGQDNQSAITQTSKPCTFKRSKNLLIKLAWIREQVDNGLVTMEYVPSTKLSADLLTKPLIGAPFHSKLKRFHGEDYIN